MPLQAMLVSSLEKVFPDKTPKASQTRLTVLKNDTLSYQIALRLEDYPDARLKVDIRIDSPLADQISIRRVDLVPSMLPLTDSRDGNFLSDQPGLYPDLLSPLPDNSSLIRKNCWTAFWVELDTDESTQAGTFPVTVSFAPVSDDVEPIHVRTELEVIDALLPKQALTVTEWFHGDCIADYYKIPVFSETHWEYMRRQIEFGVRKGLNMILTPIFTPASHSLKSLIVSCSII